MRTDYSTKIVSSSRELTVKEKITLKDFNDCTGLDTVVTNEQGFIIDPDVIVEVEVHNERAKDDKDYTTIVILDKDGTKYSTSSNSLRDSISDIMDELNDLSDEDKADLKIKVFKKPSKNYSGKYFLTATVV
ncbi:MAG: hypothetical protein VZR53_14560 [Prevotella sp.]|nr:hypothetical protein [Prevotella sp.]